MASNFPLALGSFYSKDIKESSVVCPYFKHVLTGCYPHFWSWDKCDLDSKHCPSGGCRAVFKLCFKGYRLDWLCLKLVVLPVVEV